MSIFCTNCGAKLPPGTKFCAGCGQALLTRVEGGAPPARPMPEADAQRKWTQYGQQPQYRQPIAPRPAPVRQRRRTSPALAAISGFMAIVCLCVFVLLPLIKRMNAPEGSASGRAAETATATVSAENPIVELAGARIDANILNLHDGEKTLTVTRSEAVRDDETGSAYVEYDIALGDTHQFVAPITIELPYDEALAAGGWSGIAHYDADFDLWIPLDTRIDRAAGTATASLTSLSPVRMAYYDRLTGAEDALYYILNNGHSNARAQVSHNYWQIIGGVPLTSAEEIAGEFVQNGNTNQSVQSFLTAEDVGAANTIYTLLGAVGETACVIASIGKPAAAVSNVGGTISKGIGIIGLTIAGVQLIADCSTYGMQDERTATNLLKNIATNGGTLLSLFAGFSSAGLSIGFAGVAITGVSLDIAVKMAEKMQADTVKSIFDTYYNDPGMPGNVNDAGWYRIFSEAYYEAWQNGAGGEESYQAAIEGLKQEIDRHAERFWDEIYRGGSDALSFAVAGAGQTNFYKPKPEHKAELTARYKADLYSRLQGTFSKWLNEFMLEKLQGDTYKALWTAAKPLNDYYRVIVQEIAPPDSGEPCKYQNYTLRFVCIDEGGVSFATSDYPKEWTLTAPEDDDEWAVQSDFTMLGYIQAGMPNGVALFPPDSDTDELNDAERVVEFDLQLLDSGATMVDLSVGGEISGIYTVSGSYSSKMSSYDFTDFQVRVEQNGSSMKVKFLNDTGWVLTGIYDESTKTFTGEDARVESYDGWNDAIAKSHIWREAPSVITFDTDACPIRAAWKLHREATDEPGVWDMYGEVNVNLTMIKVAEP